MTPATAEKAERTRPGRPSTGARERILAGATEVLKRDGYAGMTTAKVAAASGQNKGLIAYHFGSKQGLVAAVASQVSETLVEATLAAIGEPTNASDLVRGATKGVWAVMDRDPGVQRIYFDLSSQSMVDPEVERIVDDTKVRFREVLTGLLRSIDDGPANEDLEAAAIYLIAGIEGLALERLDRGETPALARARGMFEAGAPAAMRG